jgi:hypothetical protein
LLKQNGGNFRCDNELSLLNAKRPYPGDLLIPFIPVGGEFWSAVLLVQTGWLSLRLSTYIVLKFFDLLDVVWLNDDALLVCRQENASG